MATARLIASGRRLRAEIPPYLRQALISLSQPPQQRIHPPQQRNHRDGQHKSRPSKVGGSDGSQSGDRPVEIRVRWPRLAARARSECPVFMQLHVRISGKAP